MDERITVVGLAGPVTVRRDAWGIAHVSATTEADVWFGQGFVAAQDRLWQMEFDRRSALGTWAAVAGPTAIGADRLARRLDLSMAAHRELEAMSPDTRAMFVAYAHGVNAFLGSGLPLPVEFGLTGTHPDPWQAWHSVATFRIRHVHMGVWQQKLAQAVTLLRVGPEAYARLDLRSPFGSATLIPPGRDHAVQTLFARGAEDLAEAFRTLHPIISFEGGSNSWAVHGSRVTTGAAVVCNDSHRRLDVPTVYWQVHLTCPAFNVAGATFPGVPGLPHFGHNGSVTWNITHGCADTQDLYLEEFDPDHLGRYRTPDGWVDATHRTETIAVAGADPVPVEVWRTRHGPVVHGDPRTGWALSFRWIATDGPTRQAFEPFRPMLQARTVQALFATQEEWVDPVNNLIAADTAGTIGYQTRGVLVDRAPGPSAIRPGHEPYRQFPTAGWTDDWAWRGRVPYARNPRSINPVAGYIATANQQIIDGDDPYIADSFSPPWRAERLVELAGNARVFTPQDVAAWQADVTSVSARAWGALIARVPELSGGAGRARAMLANFDGVLRPERADALLYAHFRRAVARHLFTEVVDQATWDWLTHDPLPIATGLVSRWFSTVQAALMRQAGLAVRPDMHPRAGSDATAIADGDAFWATVAARALPAALADAWAHTVRWAGPDPATWRWDACHRTNAQHPLSIRFPTLAGVLNPPPVAVGGDGDTLQAASYAWAEGPTFEITSLSVFRHVVPMSDPAQATTIVPGGVSGVIGGAHAHDQLERWRTHRRIPAPYAADDLASQTVATLHLDPPRVV